MGESETIMRKSEFDMLYGSAKRNLETACRSTILSISGVAKIYLSTIEQMRKSAEEYAMMKVDSMKYGGRVMVVENVFCGLGNLSFEGIAEAAPIWRKAALRNSKYLRPVEKQGRGFRAA